MCTFLQVALRTLAVLQRNSYIYINIDMYDRYIHVYVQVSYTYVCVYISQVCVYISMCTFLQLLYARWQHGTITYAYIYMYIYV